jgi:hypothetical protein
MKTKLFLPLLIIIVSSLATGASAQFSVNTTNADMQPPVRLNLKEQEPITGELTNQAKQRALRKLNWRNHNLVDTKITLTGTATYFNDSWVANSQNNVTAIIMAFYYHTYTKNRFTFQFKFDGQYGMNFIDDVWFKNQDMLQLYGLTSWTIKDKGWGRNWAYSFSAKFNTQFTEGFKSRTERDVLWSNIMAPATLNAGLGLTYSSPNPKWPFVITMAPISGNVLFVMDDRLAPDRRQGLGIPVSWDDANDPQHLHPIYKNFKAEGGSNFNMSFDRTYLLGNHKKMPLRFRSTLSSFYGWVTNLSKRKLERADIPTIMPTANWSNTINFDPFKFLTIQFTHTLVYDKSQVDKVQMQYFLSIGLPYGYKNK